MCSVLSCMINVYKMIKLQFSQILNEKFETGFCQYVFLIFDLVLEMVVQFLVKVFKWWYFQVLDMITNQ